MTSPLQNVYNWVDSAVGKGFNPDGAYGYQCKDVIDAYCLFLFNDWVNTIRPSDAYATFDNSNPAFFDKIRNTAEGVPQKGDIICWDKGIGAFGHIAIILEANVNTFTVVQQNGYTNTMPAHKTTYPNYNHVIGWLRPKYSLSPQYITQADTNMLQPYQRLVGASGIKERKSPSTQSDVVRIWLVDTILDFKGFVKGESVAGNNIWFVGRYNSNYFHSSGFTNTSTNGLNDLSSDVVSQPIPPPVTPTPITPPPVTPPPVTVAPYSFNKDLPCVTEVIPAGAGHFEYNNFPLQPQKVVIHDFGTLGRDTIQSTINTFTSPSYNTSSHFVISGKRIVQMVTLKDRAYHAGANGNDFIGVETDPAQDQDTINSTKQLLRELRDKYGYKLSLIEHNQIMATQCGDNVDLNNYEIDPPIAPPVPPPVTIPDGSLTLSSDEVGFIKRLFAWLKKIIIGV